MPTYYRDTDKQLRLIMTVMRTETDRQTDKRYQVHYLPALLSYAVDNSYIIILYVL